MCFYSLNFILDGDFIRFIEDFSSMGFMVIDWYVWVLIVVLVYGILVVFNKIWYRLMLVKVVGLLGGLKVVG